MLVIGLLSTEEEAQEIQFIAKICSVEDRIRYIVHVDKIKKLVSQQNGNTSKKVCQNSLGLQQDKYL
jgi:hypothetical protein